MNSLLAVRRDPSLVVSQYQADDPEPPLDDTMPAIVKAEVIETFATSRQGAVTEVRNTKLSHKKAVPFS